MNGSNRLPASDALIQLRVFRFLTLCGVIAPVVFTFTAILGGLLRPGYSHMTDTISELFAPGSPNKPLLDSLHTTYALLMLFFGVGILTLVRRMRSGLHIGVIGASLFIAMSVISLSTATIFPQDSWGTPATLRGQMHIILHGILSLLSLAAMVSLGIWFQRERLIPGFRTYSLITVGFAFLGALFFMLNYGSPIMGLAERIPAFIGFQWTVVLALHILSRLDQSTEIDQSQ